MLQTLYIISLMKYFENIKKFIAMLFVSDKMFWLREKVPVLTA